LTHKEVPIRKIGWAGLALKEFVENTGIQDYVLLQTCNRAELYYLNGYTPPAHGFIFETGRRALEHLFRVASGLESLVVGENEILGQVRRAYIQAVREGHCSSKLGRWFELALMVGKKVRAETGISRGKVSVVSIALERVKKLAKSFDGKTVVVIGAGTIGAKVARALARYDSAKIVVANRRYERAVDLAREIGGSAHRLSELESILPGADLVVCATSAPHVILTVERALMIRKGAIVLDLSVPSNVDERVRWLKHVKLITLDDLEDESRQNIERRKTEIAKAERIINEVLAKILGKSSGVGWSKTPTPACCS
jgi:glutamyl-tRNA reductase